MTNKLDTQGIHNPKIRTTEMKMPPLAQAVCIGTIIKKIFMKLATAIAITEAALPRETQIKIITWVMTQVTLATIIHCLIAPVADVVGQHLASLQLLRMDNYVVDFRLYMTIIHKTKRTNYFGSEFRPHISQVARQGYANLMPSFASEKLTPYGTNKITTRRIRLLRVACHILCLALWIFGTHVAIPGFERPCEAR
jgi:hypothetical protein